MNRKRDLSGFGTPPADTATGEPVAAPPPERSHDPASAPPAKRPRRAAERQDGIRRITLSLPTDLAGDLKAAARRNATVYLDLILHAYADHAPGVEAGRSEPTEIAGVLLPPRRRPRPPGRTQIPLNIPEPALRTIDQAAERLGMNRSEYITELLERAL